MHGCWEPNLKLREAERMFEDQVIGPESIANIGGSARQSSDSASLLIAPFKPTDVCRLCRQMFCSREQRTGRL